MKLSAARIAATTAAGIALFGAGAAAAGIDLKRLVLKPGQCVNLAKVHVCAAKAKPVVVTTRRTVTSPAVTVTNAGATVTTPVTVTAAAVTVVSTQTVATTMTVITSAPPATTLDYSGDGSLVEPPFTLASGETLTWTWDNGNGDYPTGMYIHDDAQSETIVDSMAASGKSYLGAGEHQLSIIATGTWTIHIGG